jgi:hypothetical protein
MLCGSRKSFLNTFTVNDIIATHVTVLSTPLLVIKIFYLFPERYYPIAKKPSQIIVPALGN